MSKYRRRSTYAHDYLLSNAFSFQISNQVINNCYDLQTTNFLDVLIIAYLMLTVNYFLKFYFLWFPLVLSSVGTLPKLFYIKLVEYTHQILILIKFLLVVNQTLLRLSDLSISNIRLNVNTF